MACRHPRAGAAAAALDAGLIRQEVMSGKVNCPDLSCQREATQFSCGCTLF